MTEKFLILNADDFGMCHSYNEAVFHLLEENKISSGTLMPVTPGCEEAVIWCQKKKPRCIGLHTTLTSEWKTFRWRSLTHASSLEDENGYLFPEVEDFLKHACSEDIAEELAAQFAFFENTGIYFSHVDNHMGSLYPSPDSSWGGYLAYVYKLCHQYGNLPFRMYRRALYEDSTEIPAAPVQKDIDDADSFQIPLIDRLYSVHFRPHEGETYQSFKKEMIQLIYSLPAGINELYFHPSIDTEEIRKICSSWQRRVWEFELLFDPDFSYAIQDSGTRRISYPMIRPENRP
jgi:predicted glycoside hydrolase/deacetylase ChbG (UPF0249 family)